MCVVVVPGVKVQCEVSVRHSLPLLSDSTSLSHSDMVCVIVVLPCGVSLLRVLLPG